jgi:hypothetical protein
VQQTASGRVHLTAFSSMQSAKEAAYAVVRLHWPKDTTMLLPADSDEAIADYNRLMRQQQTTITVKEFDVLDE